MKIIDVTTATTAELVAFYNEHADTPVKRFSDRKTAERRVAALLPCTEETCCTEVELKDGELVCAKCGTPEQEMNEAKEEYAEQLKRSEICPKCGIDMLENGYDHNSAGGYICLGCGHGEDEAKPASEARSAGVSKSWQDPEVRAKRSVRHFVRVDGNEHRSVRAAFIALGLPLKEHIRFRMLLKQEGQLEAYGFRWEAIEA